MQRTHRLLFATICAVAVAAVYAGQPVAAGIADDLGWSPDSVGWLVATGQLGYLVGLILLVPLGDTVDRTRLVVVHLGLVGVGAAVVAVAPSSWLVLCGLAISGLFAVVVQTAVAYATTLSDPAERGRTLGAVTAGVVIGILGSRFLAGVLTDLWGWRSVYGALAVAAVILALVTLRVLPADRRPRTERYRQVLAEFGRLVPPVAGRGSIGFFLFASFGTLWSGMALPLAAAPWHLGQTLIGLFGLAGLAGALAAGRAGRWADSGHGDRVTGLALGLLLLSWAAIGQVSWSMSLFVVGVVLLDAAVQAVHVGNQHALTAVHPHRPSAAIGAYMIFYSTGSALGAVTTTALNDVAGWPGSSWLGAGFAAAAAAAWVVDRSLRRRRSSRPAPCSARR